MYEDFLDGRAQARCEKKIESDYYIQLAMYTDEFNPFKRGGVNMTLVIFAVLNLPPEIRQDLVFIIYTPYVLAKFKDDSFLDTRKRISLW